MISMNFHRMELKAKKQRKGNILNRSQSVRLIRKMAISWLLHGYKKNPESEYPD